MYVVIIDFDNGGKDYKVFSKSDDAIARHERIVACKLSEQSVKIDSGEFVDIADCNMFRIDATNAREAVHLVKAGKGVRFEKPLTPREKPAGLV